MGVPPLWFRVTWRRAARCAALLWAYLLLGINPLTGEMKRDWVESMKQADLRPVVQTWPVGGVIWDQVSSHRGKKIAALPIKQVFQPPYSSELNVAERVFEELRRVVEGRIYETVEHKKQAVEAVLHQLAADPQRVKRLVGWGWLRGALNSLPAPEYVSSVQ